MTETPSNSPRVNEASCMLLLFSFFALIEGIIRMTLNSKPSADVDYFDTAGGTQIPVLVFLIGGIAETFFGMAGIFVAFFQLFFCKGNRTVTFSFAIIQAVLGWYVFIVFVLAAPIKDAINTTGIPDLLTRSEHVSLIILGNLLGSVNFCWALQGGQFIMILRLYNAQRKVPEMPNRAALRAMVWSGNQIVAAISTLYVGALLDTKGFTSTTAPIGAPPHVVWFPVLSIITSIIMLAYGVIGLLSAKSRMLTTQVLPWAWVVATVAMMINFSWVFGIVPGLAPPIPGAAQHAGLILAVTVLPVFHAWRAHFPLVDSQENAESPMGDKTEAQATAVKVDNIDLESLRV